jgi:hypothetical protein
MFEAIRESSARAFFLELRVQSLNFQELIASEGGISPSGEVCSSRVDDYVAGMV